MLHYIQLINPSVSPFIRPSSVVMLCFFNMQRDKKNQWQSGGNLLLNWMLAAAACSCPLEAWLQREVCRKRLAIWVVYFQRLTCSSCFWEIAYPTLKAVSYWKDQRWSDNTSLHINITLCVLCKERRGKNKQKKNTPKL